MTGVTLVRGGLVLPAADQPALTDAAVVVEGDSVTAVLSWAEAHAQYPDAAVIGGPRFAVLPGLINAHHHGSAATSVQQGLGDGPLEPWLLAWAGARDTSHYLNRLINAARLLATGVTTTVDLWSGGGSADTYATAIGDSIRAYSESGIRVAFAPGIKTQSFLVWGDAGEDERFIAGLPAALQPMARRRLPQGQLSEDEYFAVMAETRSGLRPDQRVTLWYAAPGPQWVNDAFLQGIAERAAAADTSWQTHVNESLCEKLHGPRVYGVPTLVHLDRLGVLGPRLSVAHGVWLDDTEIEIMARTGTALSHNPSSNLRTYSGIAPLNQLLAASVTVGLGLDGMGLGDDDDMFAEMRLALRLAREPQLGRRHPRPREILGLATTGGARLMGQEQRLGRLQPGFAADMVLVDLDRARSPWAAPECDLVELLLLRCSRQDVDTVLVAGEVVFRDGAPTRFDLAAAGREFARMMAATAFPTDGAAAAARLTPHLEAWYRSWPIPPAQPRTAFNSRI